MRYPAHISSRLAFVAACFAMIFWGCSYVWSSIVFTYWNPIITITLRSFFAAILLFAGLKISKKSVKIASSDYKTLFLLALLNPFLYFIFESYGLKYSSPVTSAGIIALIPVFTGMMAFFALREKLNVLNISGIILSFCGVWLLLYTKNMNFGATWYGVLFLFLAVASSVVYAAFIQKIAIKYNPFTVIAWQNLIGSLLFLPIALVFGAKQLMTTAVTVELITSFLLLLIFASVLAFPFYTFAIKSLGVSRASVFSNLIPVVTIVVSFFMLHESITFYKAGGTALVILGVFLAQTNKKFKQHAK
jgi:drug/metabolite transporter (DMT)-like permease